MKIRTSLVHLTALCSLTCGALAQNDSPQAHIVSLTLDPQSVSVLHLRPGVVSSVRLAYPGCHHKECFPRAFSSSIEFGETERRPHTLLRLLKRGALL